MKTTHKLLFAVLVLLGAACNKQIDEIRPLTKVTVEGELASLAGIEAATTGNYYLLSGNQGNIQDLGEDRGNNVTPQDWGPVATYTDAFFYQNSNSPALGYSYGFYQASYSQVLGINTVLDNIAVMDTVGWPADDQNNLLYSKGENLFLRALTYFTLVRMYGKPYYLDGGAGLSIPLKKKGNITDNPPPSPAKEVYAFIISDLQEAAQLMKAPVSKTNIFAGTAAAWSLLSRVYLYMGGSIAKPDASANQLAVTYADSVVSGGKYALLQGQAYQNMFGNDLDGSLGRANPTGNKEIIFAIDNESSVYGTSIGEIYHDDPNGTGGAYFLPSSDLRAQFAAGDVRGTFFAVNPVSGFTETTKWLCLNLYYGTKAPNIFFRLAELYLNRAEANAKLGNIAAARTDLKAIHTRAGLPASDIDNLADADVITAVLKERRLELAFEGQNSFDYFRNGLPMTRIAADYNGTPFTVLPDDPKVEFTIPTN
ncbi:MAG TPA: RagB/SusD family nutrient uptake outer membrane protein [Puia sp.]|nr:RagB/SusD family nutrient uptake outer membrane protein [Puia sp.]